MERPKKSNKRNNSKGNSSKSKPTSNKKIFSKSRGKTTTKLEVNLNQNKIKEDNGTIRLNKFLANSGVCSRREADKMIENGIISVNGEVVTILGTKVTNSDIVKYAGERLKFEKLVYVLLNKPKNTVSTSSDPKGRKTVVELVKNICKERIYPVGRLDKETTGLLLLTNDGELTKKLTHPKHLVKKIYHVVTNKPVKKADLYSMVEGIELEDGIVKFDTVSYVGEGEDKKEIGVELHSGKNRVIRRTMEKLGYQVAKLDRVFFAGLTKKNLPRGKYRLLSEKEVGLLKMLK